MIRPLFFRYMLVVVLVALAGCALGKKEWPAAQKSEDAFNLELTLADRQARCLMVNVAVSGAIERLYSASIQYEVVGDGEGEGCIGCPSFRVMPFILPVMKKDFIFREIS